jgi:hypothetical protein
MTKTVFRLLLLVVLVFLGIWFWGKLFPDPKKAIRQRLTKLAALCSYEGKEGNISRIAAVERIGGYFADKVELSVSVPGYETHSSESRDELRQMILAARNSIPSLQAGLVDLAIDLGESKESATAEFTLDATVNGEKHAILEAFRLDLKKVDGDWVISRVQNLKTLK